MVDKYVIMYYCNCGWHEFTSLETNEVSEILSKMIECAGTMCTQDIRVFKTVKLNLEVK